MEKDELKRLVSLLEERNQLLLDKERDLADRSEELVSQKEELTAAIEEVVEKNAYLKETLAKLQQRNQELDQILYRSSHDLRSPVSSMYGLLDLLKSGGLTPSQEAIHEHLLEKANQMMSLLNSLSALSQAAFETIQSKPVALMNVIDLALQRLSSHPNFEKVTIHVSADDTLQCNADELKLTIILRCLIENALTFRAPQQEGNVWITTTREQKNLLMEVSDDGEGISSDIRDNIFNMFYRGSERSHGAGLGLYIVKSIVERLHGQVTALSKDGRTTFKVNLPDCYSLE